MWCGKDGRSRDLEGKRAWSAQFALATAVGVEWSQNLGSWLDALSEKSISEGTDSLFDF
jgi:hypothetical protein